jgi:hypothetical protein
LVGRSQQARVLLGWPQSALAFLSCCVAGLDGCPPAVVHPAQRSQVREVMIIIAIDVITFEILCGSAHDTGIDPSA